MLWRLLCILHILRCFDKSCIIATQAVAALAGLPKGGKAYDCDTIVTIRDTICYPYRDSDIRHLEIQEQQRYKKIGRLGREPTYFSLIFN